MTEIERQIQDLLVATVRMETAQENTTENVNKLVKIVENDICTKGHCKDLSHRMEKVEDDIDDFNGNTVTLTGARSSYGDVADANISIGISVSYISDTPSAGTYNSELLTLNNPFNTNVTAVTTNIKSITTQTTSTNLDTNIILQAFSCNIGTYTLKTRSF